MARFLIVLTLAMMCGVAAFYGVLKVNKPGKAVKQVEILEVLLTTQSLSRRQVVTDKDVKPKSWPKGVLSADAMIEVNNVQGHVAAVRMVTDEPVLNVELASDDREPESAVLVSEGQQTHTIQANTATSDVAESVRSCDSVGVLLNQCSNAAAETGDDTTTTLPEPEIIDFVVVDQLLEETSGKILSARTSVTLPKRRTRRCLPTWASIRGTCRCRCAIRKIEPMTRQKRHGASSTLCLPLRARFQSPPILPDTASSLNRTRRPAIRCSRTSAASAGDGEQLYGWAS